MQQIKICPDCAAEYFAHVDNCADCGGVLLTPEEVNRAQEERKRTMTAALVEPVVIREGDLKWMDELFQVLIDSGIPCLVNADTSCKRGCAGHPYRLIVSSKDAERANERIEEHFLKIHPELLVSKELASQGKCPACASPVDEDAVECPDCGLTLVVELKEKEPQKNCGDAGTCGA